MSEDADYGGVTYHFFKLGNECLGFDDSRNSLPISYGVLGAFVR